MSSRLFGLMLIVFGTSFVQNAVAQNTNQMQLTREARIQSFLKSTNPKDIYEAAIRSPKSAAFSLDGTKLYINSLEGAQTVVYNWPSLTRKTIIDHRFTNKNQDLFQNQETVFNYNYFQQPDGGVNVFRGKPVEMAFSHEGKYLWITYYRRDYDLSAQSPSAVAIVDTKTDKIVRVMPTGPIPKFVAVSADNQRVAITNWGDNTVGIIDISSNLPSDFKYISHLTVEKQFSQAGLEGKDRDAECGFCLRGTVFSPDSRNLFVARMGGGGVAVFDVVESKYLGSVMDFRGTPRHIVVTPDEKELVISSNQAGYVTRVRIDDMLNLVINANGKRVKGITKKEAYVGLGARTLEVDPTGRVAFVAVNNDVKVVAVDLLTMKTIAEHPIDKFPVGLAISKDGNYLAVTSQGHAGQGGGNAVNIVKINRFAQTPIP